jgi:hypothetical protein
VKLELIMTPLQSSTQSEVITDEIVANFHMVLEYYAGFSREVSRATIRSALLAVQDDIVDKKVRYYKNHITVQEADLAVMCEMLRKTLVRNNKS